MKHYVNELSRDDHTKYYAKKFIYHFLWNFSSMEWNYIKILKLYRNVKIFKNYFFSKNKILWRNIEKSFEILYFDMESFKINKLFDKTCVNIFLSNLWGG
jgi:type IV secretory pathway VirB6-like protein